MYMGPYLLMASVKAVRALQLKKTNIMRMEKHGGTLSLKLISFFFRIYLFLELYIVTTGFIFLLNLGDFAYYLASWGGHNASQIFLSFQFNYFIPSHLSYLYTVFYINPGRVRPLVFISTQTDMYRSPLPSLLLLSSTKISKIYGFHIYIFGMWFSYIQVGIVKRVCDESSVQPRMTCRSK